VLKTFMSYKFEHSESEDLVSQIKILFRPLEIFTVDGKTLNPTEGLNAQIKERIDQTQALIAIQFREEESQYVSQELGYALGKKIPAIVVTDDEFAARGLVSDQYLILLQKGGLSLATDLVKATAEIKKKLSISSQPTLSQHVATTEIDLEGWIFEVRELLRQLRSLISSLQFPLALKLANQIIDDHPDCWRAYIAKSACLVHLYRYDDAQEVLQDIIKKFSSHRRALSHAYQNLGWVLERKAISFDASDFKSRVQAYRMSLSFEKRLSVVINLIYSLLVLDNITEAETVFAECLGEFSETKSEFERRIVLEGSPFVQQIGKSQLILAIVFPPNK
jgi:tetratricopeptide (TPR) repeat protein